METLNLGFNLYNYLCVPLLSRHLVQLKVPRVGCEFEAGVWLHQQCVSCFGGALTPEGTFGSFGGRRTVLACEIESVEEFDLDGDRWCMGVDPWLGLDDVNAGGSDTGGGHKKDASVSAGESTVPNYVIDGIDMQYLGQLQGVVEMCKHRISNGNTTWWPRMEYLEITRKERFCDVYVDTAERTHAQVY
ncbi:hypothetical protein BGZ47_000835 [Haplosporangium gracile]|nr:hypothetical protein BGZ47_000835 [Haplosporangium gracile]